MLELPLYPVVAVVIAQVVVQVTRIFVDAHVIKFVARETGRKGLRDLGVAASGLRALRPHRSRRDSVDESSDDPDP